MFSKLVEWASRVSLIFSNNSKGNFREKQQEFLLALSDALRPLSDTVEIETTAFRLLGEHLKVDRVYYAQLDYKDERWTVDREYSRGTSVSMVGKFEVSDYSWVLPFFNSGNFVVVEDIHRSKIIASSFRAAMEKIQIAAVVAVPLIKNGRLISALSVTETMSRKWMPDEVELVRETLERTWASVERARTEAALRLSEEKYRTLFESIDEGFCVVEIIRDENSLPIDLRYLEHNQAFARQSGLYNVIGKTHTDLGLKTERHWFEKYDEVARTGIACRIESYHEPTKRWYKVFISRADSKKSDQVVLVFDDISERIQAEAALRESEQRMRRVLENDAVGVLFFNKEGYLIDANQTFLRMTGYTQRDLNSCVLHWRNLTPPEYIPISEAQSEKFDSTGRIGPYEKEYIFRDGSKCWMLFAGSDLGDGSFVEFCVDISERKRAEKALREADLRFRAMADTAPVLIWETDTDGITFVNGQFLKFFGVSLDSVRRRGWVNYLHPDDKEEYLKIYNRAFNGRNTFDYDCRFRRADGQYRWLRNIGRPLNEKHFVGCALDITEPKQAEEALLEADRMKNQFLATLAHELRNPLAPISNGLHILQMPQVDKDTSKRIHEMMERQVNYLVRLVDDLMEVSRITRGIIELRIEQINLTEVLINIIENNKIMIENENHQFNLNIEAHSLIIEADKVRLAQIITNLLNNAIKYTPPEGCISLNVRREGFDALISVCDNGIGIPIEMHSKIFDMFTQADQSIHRAQGGLGIGLTLAKILVQLHGGNIEVKSEGINKGSEFIIRLPLSGETLEDKYINDSERNLYSSTFHRILIVDDNQDAADSLALVLKNMVDEVETVYDGFAALNKIESFWPSVVLLDIGMPVLDGYEIARQIRQIPGGENIKILALTGWGQEKDYEKSQEAGFNHHLVKPINLDIFRELLNAWSSEIKS